MSAQTEKGTIMMGGNVGYNSNVNKRTNIASGVRTLNIRNRAFSFDPSIGYFLKDNFVVGVNFNLSSNKTVYTYDASQSVTEQTYNQKNTGAGLFATKYFMLNTTFGFYAGLSAGGGNSKDKQTNVSNAGITTTTFDSKGTYMSVQANGGVAYFPTQQISLQAGIGNIGWNKYKSNDNTNKSDNSSFNAGINSLTLQFGLYYFFKS